MGQPFSRFNALMGVIAVTLASAAAAGTIGLTRREAVLEAGGYDSRGHGQGFRYSNSDGSARVRRAACKARNRRRNKLAHR